MQVERAELPEYSGLVFFFFCIFILIVDRTCVLIRRSHMKHLKKVNINFAGASTAEPCRPAKDAYSGLSVVRAPTGGDRFASLRPLAPALSSYGRPLRTPCRRLSITLRAERPASHSQMPAHWLTGPVRRRNHRAYTAASAVANVMQAQADVSSAT